MSLRINAGSGQRPFAGWVNIDSQEKWRAITFEKGGAFICCDMAKMPYTQGSVDMVVSHQSHEHADPHREGAAFLREAYRVLKPDGSLLIFTPDAEALARRWLRYRDRVNAERSWGSEAREGEINDFIYFVNLHGAWMGNESDRHKWSFTFDELERFLRDAAPWREIKPFDWREIPGADLARDWWVLSVEAIR